MKEYDNFDQLWSDLDRESRKRKKEELHKMLMNMKIRSTKYELGLFAQTSLSTHAFDDKLVKQAQKLADSLNVEPVLDTSGDLSKVDRNSDIPGLTEFALSLIVDMDVPSRSCLLELDGSPTEGAASIIRSHGSASKSAHYRALLSSNSGSEFYDSWQRGRLNLANKLVQEYTHIPKSDDNPNNFITTDHNPIPGGCIHGDHTLEDHTSSHKRSMKKENCSQTKENSTSRHSKSPKRRDDQLEDVVEGKKRRKSKSKSPRQSSNSIHGSLLSKTSEVVDDLDANCRQSKRPQHGDHQLEDNNEGGKRRQSKSKSYTQSELSLNDNLSFNNSGFTEGLGGSHRLSKSPKRTGDQLNDSTEGRGAVRRRSKSESFEQSDPTLNDSYSLLDDTMKASERRKSKSKSHNRNNSSLNDSMLSENSLLVDDLIGSRRLSKSPKRSDDQLDDIKEWRGSTRHRSKSDSFERSDPTLSDSISLNVSERRTSKHKNHDRSDSLLNERIPSKKSSVDDDLGGRSRHSKSPKRSDKPVNNIMEGRGAVRCRSNSKASERSDPTLSDSYCHLNSSVHASERRTSKSKSHKRSGSSRNDTMSFIDDVGGSSRQSKSPKRLDDSLNDIMEGVGNTRRRSKSESVKSSDPTLSDSYSHLNGSVHASRRRSSNRKSHNRSESSLNDSITSSKNSRAGDLGGSRQLSQSPKRSDDLLNNIKEGRGNIRCRSKSESSERSDPTCHDSYSYLNDSVHTSARRKSNRKNHNRSESSLNDSMSSKKTWVDDVGGRRRLSKSPKRSDDPLNDIKQGRGSTRCRSKSTRSERNDHTLDDSMSVNDLGCDSFHCESVERSDPTLSDSYSHLNDSLHLSRRRNSNRKNHNRNEPSRNDSMSSKDSRPGDLGGSRRLSKSPKRSDDPLNDIKKGRGSTRRRSKSTSSEQSDDTLNDSIPVNDLGCDSCHCSNSHLNNTVRAISLSHNQSDSSLNDSMSSKNSVLIDLLKCPNCSDSHLYTTIKESERRSSRRRSRRRSDHALNDSSTSRNASKIDLLLEDDDGRHNSKSPNRSDFHANDTLQVSAERRNSKSRSARRSDHALDDSISSKDAGLIDLLLENDNSRYSSKSPNRSDSYINCRETTKKVRSVTRHKRTDAGPNTGMSENQHIDGTQSASLLPTDAQLDARVSEKHSSRLSKSPTMPGDSQVDASTAEIRSNRESRHGDSSLPDSITESSENVYPGHSPNQRAHDDLLTTNLSCRDAKHPICSDVTFHRSMTELPTSSHSKSSKGRDSQLNRSGRRSRHSTSPKRSDVQVNERDLEKRRFLHSTSPNRSDSHLVSSKRPMSANIQEHGSLTRRTCSTTSLELKINADRSGRRQSRNLVGDGQRDDNLSLATEKCSNRHNEN